MTLYGEIHIVLVPTMFFLPAFLFPFQESMSFKILYKFISY